MELVLLTHVHYDHIGAVEDIQEATGAGLAVPRLEEPSFRNPARSLLGTVSDLQADRLLDEGDVVCVGELSFRVMSTPGHTAGSCCYVGDGVIFSGDTLFAGDVGPHGSARRLRGGVGAFAGGPGGAARRLPRISRPRSGYHSGAGTPL